VPKIVVDVMPKAELLDPQGKAVAGALARLGNTTFTDVRVGKRFELTVDGHIDQATLTAAREIARELLSNLVIEDVVGVYLVDGGSAEAATSGTATGRSDRDETSAAVADGASV
jgi:phosphoribosylformylglycinamidine synthase